MQRSTPGVASRAARLIIARRTAELRAPCSTHELPAAHSQPQARVVSLARTSIRDLQAIEGAR